MKSKQSSYSDTQKQLAAIVLGIALLITAITSYVFYQKYQEEQARIAAQVALEAKMAATYTRIFGETHPTSEKEENEKLQKIWITMLKLHKDRIWYENKGKVTTAVSGKIAPLLDKGKAFFSEYIYKLEEPSSTAEKLRKADEETKRLLEKSKADIEDAKAVLKYYDINLNPIPDEKELLTGAIEENVEKQFGYKVPNEYARKIAEQVLALGKDANTPIGEETR